jgi:two-component system nitrogen regulation sensor histidine kinase NtrY
VKTRRRELGYELRLFLITLVAGTPAVAAAVWLLFATPHALKVIATLLVAIALFWIGGAFVIRQAVQGPLYTLANLLLALREGDYSIRGRTHRRDDALDAALTEVNLLGDRLRDLKVGALEAAALLEKVLTEVDVAIFAIDDESRLALFNRAAEHLVGKEARGKTATELGLATLLKGDVPRIVDQPLAGARGQWELRRTHFRQDGKPHILIVLTDVQRALREEERQAWQRLVRVLGHEINNSLAPIQSIAGSLRAQLDKPERPDDADADLRSGLDVIERRAESLGRFLKGYAQLTRLPPPRKGDVDVAAWAARVAQLEKRLPVRVVGSEPLHVTADADQLDQLLINLVKNAVDAALPEKGGVELDWSRRHDRLELRVRDEGPGLLATANLFVPFFTTKPQGMGIGLVLSRQIAEAHGGSLHLYNREDGRGCEALLTLPLA